MTSLVEARMREAAATGAAVVAHVGYVRLELLGGDRMLTRIVTWDQVRSANANPLTEMIRRMREELQNAD